jgi:biopolymer transport protein ExbB
MKSNLLPLLLLVAVNATAAKKPVIDERENEIILLKDRLASQRDSLQHEIADRWHKRQRAVERREGDKEEIARLIDLQEKARNAAVSAREEGYSLERRVEEAEKAVDGKKQESLNLRSVLGDILDKEAEAIGTFFPLDIDSARVHLESLRRNFAKKNNVLTAINLLADYVVATVRYGCLMSLRTATLLPDGGEAQGMSVARFGTVFAYGIDDTGAVVTIGQSGREGVDRYRIRRITNPQLQQKIVSWYGAGGTGGWPSGPVSVDIMQSDLSGSLVTGAKETATARLRRFVKAGGPVMVPLGLLPLWALVLVVLKLVQFVGRRSSARKTFLQAAALLERADREGVHAFIARRKGPAARTVRVCMAPAVVSRQAAESTAREILSAEASRLGAHLNTLAVIAGVAPLLGLLGTVTGMIRLFEVITRFGTGDPKLLAGGISEALITTEVGLIIAVPVLLLHNFLRNYKNRIAAELQIGTLRIVNRLFPEA